MHGMVRCTDSSFNKLPTPKCESFKEFSWTKNSTLVCSNMDKKELHCDQLSIAHVHINMFALVYICAHLNGFVEETDSAFLQTSDEPHRISQHLKAKHY